MSDEETRAEPVVVTVPIIGVIPPSTLATLRALRQAETGARARMDEVLVALVEGAGHDLAGLVVTALDLGEPATYTLGPRSP